MPPPPLPPPYPPPPLPPPPPRASIPAAPSPSAATAATVSSVRLAHLVAQLLALVGVELPGVGELLAVQLRGRAGRCGLRERARPAQGESARGQGSQDDDPSHLSDLLAARGRGLIRMTGWRPSRSAAAERRRRPGRTRARSRSRRSSTG